jgi:hypothetical protein
MFEAKIIQDSICNGQRLTTMQVTHPRVVHSEFNTHAAFAKNSASSRAIPFKKAVQRVIDDPFIPEHWGINQSGMQAFTELTGMKRKKAIAKWLEARDNAIAVASEMAAEKCAFCNGTGEVTDINEVNPYGEGQKAPTYPCQKCGGDGLGLNVHKQIVNRLIEPWAWITVCVTGDAGAWSNYFALRCEKDAQPDIQKQAYMAQKAYYTSTPRELQPGEWHTPYITNKDYADIHEWVKNNGNRKLSFTDAIIQISTGRCARTSYLTQEGTRDFAKDIELHDRLRYHIPLHASPFEQVCQAKGDDVKYAKYTGWEAYRHMLPREYVTDFQPNHPDLVQA